MDEDKRIYIYRGDAADKGGRVEKKNLPTYETSQPPLCLRCLTSAMLAVCSAESDDISASARADASFVRCACV